MSDDSGRFELTRRRLLGGITATGVAAGGVGAGTWAYFQDTESSDGNTVQAGTMDLKLGDVDEGLGDGVSGTFTASNIAPGKYVSGTVEAQNAGSIRANHTEIKIEANGTEAEGNGNDEGDTVPESGTNMAKLFKVSTLQYPKQNTQNPSLKEQLSDYNGNGIVDLDDVMQHGVFDDLQPAPQPGGTRSLSMTLQFISTETTSRYTGSLDDDDFQGDDLSITVKMALAQDAGQNVL